MSECILWPGDHIKPNGYGWTMHEGKVVYAHRLVMGFPEGIVGHVCHDDAAHRGECEGGSNCLHRRCVNKAHLVVMTQSENLGASPLTLVARRYSTHCAQDHEFTKENTIMESKGKGYRGRKCRACATAARHAREARA